MVCIAIQDGRGEEQYCAIVLAMQGGGGEPEQGGYLLIIVWILGQGPQTKRISCKGQVVGLTRGLTRAPGDF